jgi:hypothetical protein
MKATGHLWIQQLTGQYSLHLIKIYQPTDHQSFASIKVWNHLDSSSLERLVI